MSDTPRTDAFAQKLTRAKVPASRVWPHWYDHSADLERELARTRQAAERLAEALECRDNSSKWENWAKEALANWEEVKGE